MNRLTALKSPISVNFELTRVCNLQCGFCCSSSATNLHKHPTIEQVRRIIDALHAAEVFEIRWFGGEFLTFGPWRDVLTYARDLGFFMAFVSNCTRMTRESARHLAACGITGGAVSIHGPEDVHDRIVNSRGAFRRAIEGIRYCWDEKIGVSTLFTPTQQNFRSVYDLARWYRDNDVPVGEIVVGRLCPCGEATGDWEKTRLSLADYQELFRLMRRITRDFGIHASMGDAFPLCMIPHEDWELVTGCWQGTGFGQISYTGDVKSCSILGGVYGNVLETPLTDIWTQRLAPMRSLQYLPFQCRLCPHFCGGGCSATRPGTTHYAADDLIPHPSDETPLTIARRLPGFAAYHVRNSLAWIRDRHTNRLEARDPSPPSGKPRITCRYRIRDDLHGSIGFFKGGGVITFDDEAARILRMIDGQRTVDEIAENLAQIEERDAAETRRDVQSFIRSFNHGGLLAFSE